MEGGIEMKALCIIASPKDNGSTAYLIDTIIKGIRENGAEVSRYSLGKNKINYCIGCKKCHETGECFQNDDVNRIIKDMSDSDIVIIGSPSYWGDITGQLKVFFDRNTPYSNTNPKCTFKHRKRIGLSIAIRTGTHEEENIHIIKTIEHYFGHMGIKAIASLSVCGVSVLEDLLSKKDVIRNAYELGVRITKEYRGWTLLGLINKCEKPNIKIYEKVLSDLNKIEIITMIGDSYVADIQEAKRAGIDAFLIRKSND